VLDLDEGGAAYLTAYHAYRKCYRMPAELRDEFVLRMVRDSHDVLAEMALARGCEFYCDSLPKTIFAARLIARVMPRALFVLCIRHYAGAIQSLARSFDHGYSWAGAELRSQARVWATCNAYARFLPLRRTTVMSYDRLCSQPDGELAYVSGRLRELGFTPEPKSDYVLAMSVATGGQVRPTIGSVDGAGGVALSPIASFDPTLWSRRDEEEVAPIVLPVFNELRRRFGDRIPGAPAYPG
jgi:hypothetical protein